MKKNILIIGGDSFIATNFINHYKDVFSIKIISRKQTHFLNENVVKNIFNISDNFFKNIDVVINFCAIVHKKNVSKKTYKNINYELPVFLFNKSLSLGVKHFIQMSTISVYGRKSKIKFNSKLNPENSYGFYKLNVT